MPLDPFRLQELAARLQYYRELGIYDFYRRNSGCALSPDAETTSITDQAAGVTPALPADQGLDPANPESDVLDHAQALRIIREDLGDCTRCRLHRLGRKQIVFGVGNPNAELVFVGEGPGADEDELGEPFVGRAGQLLNKMIEAMGLRREQVYIANVVKCRPPQNRTPETEECDTCSPFLLRQIAVIQPKAIVALGAVAARTLLRLNEPMARLRGRFYDVGSSRLVVTYHPAYLLRDPRQKTEAWKDLQLVMRYLGLKSPKSQTS